MEIQSNGDQPFRQMVPEREYRGVSRDHGFIIWSYFHESVRGLSEFIGLQLLAIKTAGIKYRGNCKTRELIKIALLSCFTTPHLGPTLSSMCPNVELKGPSDPTKQLKIIDFSEPGSFAIPSIENDKFFVCLQILFVNSLTHSRCFGFTLCKKNFRKKPFLNRMSRVALYGESKRL